MFFAVTSFLFNLFAHAALVIGFAVLVLRHHKAADFSPVLPFASVPLILLGLIELYMHGAESFISQYGGTKYEADVMQLKTLGTVPTVYFYLFAAVSTQVFWIPKYRKSAAACLLVGLLNLFR